MSSRRASVSSIVFSSVASRRGSTSSDIAWEDAIAHVAKQAGGEFLQNLTNEAKQASGQLLEQAGEQLEHKLTKAAGELIPEALSRPVTRHGPRISAAAFGAPPKTKKIVVSPKESVREEAEDDEQREAPLVRGRTRRDSLIGGMFKRKSYDNPNKCQSCSDRNCRRVRAKGCVLLRFEDGSIFKTTGRAMGLFCGQSFIADVTPTTEPTTGLKVYDVPRDQPPFKFAEVIQFLESHAMPRYRTTSWKLAMRNRCKRRWNRAWTNGAASTEVLARLEGAELILMNILADVKDDTAAMFEIGLWTRAYGLTDVSRIANDRASNLKLLQDVEKSRRKYHKLYTAVTIAATLGLNTLLSSLGITMAMF